jgi:hypothetical protein
MKDRGGGRAEGDFPRGWEGHRRAQAGIGLRLTPAERLRWLQETLETLRRWQGRARAPSAPAGPRGSPEGGA